MPSLSLSTSLSEPLHVGNALAAMMLHPMVLRPLLWSVRQRAAVRNLNRILTQRGLATRVAFRPPVVLWGRGLSGLPVSVLLSSSLREGAAFVDWNLSSQWGSCCFLHSSQVGAPQCLQVDLVLISSQTWHFGQRFLPPGRPWQSCASRLRPSASFSSV
jgi:hypothetical protein